MVRQVPCEIKVSWTVTVLKVKKPIRELICEMRGHKVVLDADLAELHGVSTKAFNQAVKRNAEQPPTDFAFRLTLEEAEALQRSRSQIVTLKRGHNIKYRPRVSFGGRVSRMVDVSP